MTTPHSLNKNQGKRTPPQTLSLQYRTSSAPRNASLTTPRFLSEAPTEQFPGRDLREPKQGSLRPVSEALYSKKKLGRKMNKKQRITIVVGLLIILILISYPPWKAYSKLGYPPRVLRYSFIFDPPEGSDQPWIIKINTTRLLVNVGLTLIATFGFVWIFKEKNS